MRAGLELQQRALRRDYGALWREGRPRGGDCRRGAVFRPLDAMPTEALRASGISEPQSMTLRDT